MVLRKSRKGSRVGVNCATNNWIPSKKVRINILTLTNHASQVRSSKVDCIQVPMDSQKQRTSFCIVALYSCPAITRRNYSQRPAGRHTCSLPPGECAFLTGQFRDHGKQRHI